VRRFPRVARTLLACDKIPAQAKDASKRSIEQQRRAWSKLQDPDVPVEARRAAASGCTQGIDALRQSADARGCSL